MKDKIKKQETKKVIKPRQAVKRKAKKPVEKLICKCGQPIAVKHQNGVLAALNGAKLDNPIRQAPRIRCPKCNTVTILLEGSPM